jgi:hypothetical protein
MVLPRGSWSAFFVLLSACGGQAQPPAAALEPAAAPSAEPVAPVRPEAAAPAEPVASTSADAEPAKPKPEAASESGTSRNVKYMVSPDGMRVEVEGLALTPKAEAVKAGAGWNIKIKVEARAKDDEAHVILTPKGTEIALAGSIRRAGGGEAESFGDTRGGDQEITVKGNKAVTFTRTWPAAGGPKALAAGDEAEFMVGLWGVGADSASLRPLKKFCKISVKLDKAKPRVMLGPPDGVTR